MKTNFQLQIEVQEALQNKANFKVDEIGVIASEGKITIWGIQAKYSRIRVAEETIRRVIGVNEIINLIYMNKGTINHLQKNDVAVELASYLVD